MPFKVSLWSPSWISGKVTKAAYIVLTLTNRILNLNLKHFGTKNMTLLLPFSEGIARHKPGVCEAKHAKHKLLTTKSEYDTLMANKEKNIISVRSLTAVLQLLEKETAEER